MSWTELHAELPYHPKITRLKIALDCDRVTSIGYVCALWCYAVQCCRGGVLSNDDWVGYVDFCGSHCDGDKLRDAMVSVGWIDANEDGSFSCHDWHEYAGRLEILRENNRVTSRERMRALRSGLKNVCSNINKSASKVRGLPNLTRPNQTRGGQKAPPPPDEISKAASDIVTELTPLAPYRDEIETLIRKWLGEGRGKLASIVKKIRETAIEAAATATGKNTRYAPARAMEAIRALDFDKGK